MNSSTQNTAMTEPLRITFVSRKWPPAMGGMETYSERLSSCLCSYGDVTVIALAGHADGSTPRPWELVIFGLKTAFALIFTNRPASVVHVADMASWPLALAARLRSPSTRRILSAHGTDVSFPRRGGVIGRLYGAYLRLGARLLGAVTVVANSAETAKAAKSFGFRDTVVVPLAAEAAFVADAPDIPEQTILFSGRLIRLKGCKWFIENVLPHLPETLELEVAGTIWDDDEFAALKAPRVRYVGRLDQADLHRRMVETLCVVIPNIEIENGQFEGFGLVAVEAAAVGGIPVVARQAGLKEAVIDNQTGFLITSGDAGQWVEKIKEISAWSPQDRTKFKAQARAAVETHYSWDRVARETALQYCRASRGN